MRRGATLIAKGLDEIARERSAEARGVEEKADAIESLAKVQRRQPKIGHQFASGRPGMVALGSERGPRSRGQRRHSLSLRGHHAPTERRYAIVPAAFVVRVHGRPALRFSDESLA
jgi:hypothetical protein